MFCPIVYVTCIFTLWQVCLDWVISKKICISHLDDFWSHWVNLSVIFSTNLQCYIKELFWENFKRQPNKYKTNMLSLNIMNTIMQCLLILRTKYLIIVGTVRVHTSTMTFNWVNAQGLVTSPFLVYEVIQYNIQSKGK